MARPAPVPVRRPRKNGVVERSQGAGKRWAEPGRCDSAAQLQRRRDEMDRLQREEDPRGGGRSRMELFPDLRCSGRPYAADAEASAWDWGRVAEHLAGSVAARRVDRAGVVWLYNRQHYVGTAYRGQTLFASFDPHSREWIFRDRGGTQVRTRPAPELAAEAIRALHVTHRRGKTRTSELPARPDVA